MTVPEPRVDPDPPERPQAPGRPLKERLTRPDWLEARRNGIGGSDAAAICGLDPCRSAFELLLDKTRVVVDDDRAGEAAQWGRLLEPVIADEVARREQLDV
jgi:predicted phage-related endonuclease